MTTIARPGKSEFADYYTKYVNLVPDGDIRSVLRQQMDQTLAVAKKISEDRSAFRYQEGKWSLRELLSHMNDTERVFAFRALWFARGFDTPLASFDQDVAVASAGADSRSWQSHVDDFRAVRTATLTLFDGFSDEAFNRRGIASSNPVTVRGLAYIIAGHVAHHVQIIKERYV